MARALSILVLDDNADNADALAELLAMEDHKVKVV
jgi:CheY-like chemotaxis protein